MPKYTEEAIQEFVERLDDVTQTRLDYETEHKDAGDAYSHLVKATRDDRDVMTSFKEWLDKSDVRKSGLPFGKIFELVLENFKMKPGHIFSGSEDDEFVIQGFPVQEIELDLREVFATADVPFKALPQVRDRCEMVINDDDYGYMTTDSVWIAYISKKDVQEIIDAWVNH